MASYEQHTITQERSMGQLAKDRHFHNADYHGYRRVRL
jgi:hypothetical protein